MPDFAGRLQTFSATESQNSLLVFPRGWAVNSSREDYWRFSVSYAKKLFRNKHI